MIFDFRIYETDLKEMIECPPDMVAYCLKNHPDKLMMFTGFHDRNGKKIYDGDYILIPYDEHRMYKSVDWKGKRDGIYLVHFSKKNGGWFMKDISDPFPLEESPGGYIWIHTHYGSRCEVIGHKYQPIEI